MSNLYTVYLAGPMTGIPQFNYPAFDSMQRALERAGFRVISPAELDDPEDRATALASKDGHIGSVKHTWGFFLARDVAIIADGGVDAIVVLPGWGRSRGARLETFVGFLCGKRTFTLDATYGELRKVSFLSMARAWLAKDDISFHTESEPW